MTSRSKRDPADVERISTIEQRLLNNPEMAALIDELAHTSHDANDLVRGLLRASINRGLNAEMDAHLGYTNGNRDDRLLLLRR